MRLVPLGFLLCLTLAAFAGDSQINIHVTDDGASHASWTRDGVRYETYDRDVMRAIDAALEKHREIAREHREIGRKHREIGREHARIGREHARASRERARDRDEDELEKAVRQGKARRVR